MAKRANRYRLTLEPLLASGEESESLRLEFENHDDVFNIIRRLREKDPFHDVQQATEFAIGIKLFSEVMIKNRTHPLFDELLPAFRIFMEKLKR
ncbi:DUF3861 domain-containing protein [Spirosoma arcticum]